MSSDAKLQKVILGPDWIDLSFGEPKVVAQALYRNLSIFGDPFQMPTRSDLLKWEYQPAAGNPKLIQLLEEKYDAKVVVCNGAKHALAATLNAFKKSGIDNIYYDSPYYPANPQLIDVAGLNLTDINNAQAFLITSPNNPDGKNYTNLELINFCHMGKKMIHDAAYYSDIYLPDGQIPIPVGDVQIYSMSKMYGVSGLRIGYAICHDEKYYRDIVDYMELSTAGVSTASQDIAFSIEEFFINNPKQLESFRREAREAIAAARQELLNLDPEVLVPVPSASNSMFAWCLKGHALDNVAAKVHILDGVLFGQPGMMRINIAHPVEVIREAVQRLNQHKIRS
jgi:aspartate/methionine/tyrosine aminotransferase